MKSESRHKSKVKYLVLGASGLLGSRLLEILSRSAHVQGTYFRRPARSCIFCDLSDAREVRRAVELTSPEIVVHVAGMTRPDECEADKDLAYRVNVEGMDALVDFAGDAKIVFFSTDYVFDGTKGSYAEDDAPCPINHYGATKLAAERLLLDRRPDSLILRVSGLFGTCMWYEEFLRSMGKRQQVPASAEHKSSYTYIDDICSHLPTLVGMSGVVHFVGHDVFSRFEFTSLTCQILCADFEVVAISGDAAYPTVRRPRDSSLVSSRLRLPMTPTTTALHKLRKALSSYDKGDIL